MGLLKRILFLLILLQLFTPTFGQQNNWLTYYEQSGLLETPRYNETMQFIQQLDEVSDQLSAHGFGFSPQGRELIYVVYDRDGLSEPQAIREAGRIVLFVQACIHPGESEGKDAMLIMLRDLVIHNKNTELFDKVSLLFIPIFNVDGHERFNAHSRINQNGPKEMGWRTTAQNLNLNRDFLKADAPEMKAWLKLYDLWQPEFFIDTHTSDGADYQYVITYALETGGNMETELTQWQAKVYLPLVQEKMEIVGFPMFPYVSFRRWHDPRSGLISNVGGPMFSQGYTAIRNRPGLLVETHMLKPYKLRVESTEEIIKATLEVLNIQHLILKDLIFEADTYISSKAFRQQPFPLRFTVDMTDSIMVPFKGFSYEVHKSDLTGGDWFVYDNKKPVDFRLPLFEQSKPLYTVKLPEAYIIPAEWQEVIERMKLHGIEMFPLEEERKIQTEYYQFTQIEWQRSTYEGRHRIAKMQFDTKQNEVAYPAGSMVVPMNQPLTKVIAHILEPRGNGSLLEWGFFDIIFEQKEYAESYVMEPLARIMLDTIPLLREAYEHKMSTDSLFAENAWQQLNWFYSKTPWWDSQYNRYPIGRILDEKIVPKESLRQTK
ncbi:MAG: hypothetical protein CVT92_16890 [Bacteroidetes bacterium HGW-Bacteroidetes-1]|jgi:hypothetical protein|nr:MAG: hypothetical protein CVT92_16890 [Bacteroidetes bacterium HGW-Bacteroidetes-1]